MHYITNPGKTKTIPLDPWSRLAQGLGN